MLTINESMILLCDNYETEEEFLFSLIRYSHWLDGTDTYFWMAKFP